MKQFAKVKAKVKDNPLELAKHRVSQQKSNAKRRDIAWTVSDDDMIHMFATATHCSISGIKLVYRIDNRDAPSIDRIDSRKGYEPNNVQIVANRVNIAKNKSSMGSFIALCAQVVKHNKV